MQNKRLQLALMYVLTFFIVIASIVLFFVVLIVENKNEKNFNPPALPIKTPSDHYAYRCPNKNLIILAIDGGGTRGIIPLYFLTQFEKLSGKSTASAFNQVSGISTGSIIATVINIPDKNGHPKYSAQKLLTLYRDDSLEVFTRTLKHSLYTLGGTIGPRYSNKGKYKMLRSYYHNETLSDLLTNVSVYGYDSFNKKILTFCSWKGCPAAGKNYQLNDIISGTTAIMGLFPPKIFLNHSDNLAHIINDVSIIVNNPSYFAYQAAREACPNVKNYIIVSLGTGYYPADNISTSEVEAWGAIQWLPEIITSAIESNISIENSVMRLFSEQGTKNQHVYYFRINPKLNWGNANPLDTSPKHQEALIGISADYAKKHQAKIQCIAELLKTNTLSKACITAFNED